jgi:hypothetical protein
VITNRKEKTMDAQAYIDQLKEYAKEFPEWWIKPFEKFHADFDEQNKKLLLGFLPIQVKNKEIVTKFNEAVKHFEKEVLQKRNLFEEIFAFFDTNYEAYVKATELQRSEIRSIISDTFCNLRYEEKPLNYYERNYMQMIIKKYIWHVFKKFKSIGDEIWLTRSLVAVSIENGGYDFRETLTYLARLYVTAERNNIEPEKIFISIAEISSQEVGDWMMNIGSYEVTKQERSLHL